MLGQKENFSYITAGTDIDDGSVSEEFSIRKRERSNFEFNKIRKEIQKTLQPVGETLDNAASKTAKVLIKTYPLFDSCHIANSGFRLMADILEPDNDAALLYMLRSPAGIGGLVGFSAFLTLIAYVSGMNTKKQSVFSAAMIRHTGTLYKDLREFLQSTKYAWKSARQLAKLFQRFAKLDLPINTMVSIVVPFVIITRIAMRHFREKRKEMQDHNKRLLKLLESQNTDSDFLLSKIKQADKHLDEAALQLRMKQLLDQYFTDDSMQQEIKRMHRYWHYTTLGVVFLNASVDALYIYFGLIFFIPLAAVPLPLIHVMLGLCVVYGLALVLSRVMEEYQQQQQLEVTALECEMMEIGNRCHMLYDAIYALRLNDPDNAPLLALLKKELQETKVFYFELAKKKQALNTGFTASALWVGLRGGLGFISVLGTTTAMLATILACFGTVVPPLMPVLVIMLGVVFLAAGMAGTYLYRRHQAATQDSEEEPTLPPPDEVESAAPESLSQLSLAEIDMKSPIKQPVDLPLTEDPGLFENVRKLLSGFSKSFKLGSQFDEDSSPVSLSISFGIATISAVVHGCYGYSKSNNKKEEQKSPAKSGLGLFPVPKPKRETAANEHDDAYVPRTSLSINAGSSRTKS